MARAASKKDGPRDCAFLVRQRGEFALDSSHEAQRGECAGSERGTVL
ncbi:MAG: hypothetical protein CNCCGFBP_01041 [Fimbriimonadaceae bacterium]|nr:hypothetical protein [Fimbriimonadaceae bacterium]